VQTKVSRSLTSGEFANASSLYLALPLLGRSSPAQMGLRSLRKILV
jgi:hypothetical protein